MKIELRMHFVDDDPETLEAFLTDDGQHALYVADDTLFMLRVQPVGGHYKPTEVHSGQGHIYLGETLKSTAEAATSAIETLYKLSAFELLTRHYDPNESLFHITNNEGASAK